jgi:hypothetical protein
MKTKLVRILSVALIALGAIFMASCQSSYGGGGGHNHSSVKAPAKSG